MFNLIIYPLPSFVKHGLALQDDFGMQKILVNKHKQLVLGETPFPTPSLGFIPAYSRFFNVFLSAPKLLVI